MRTRMGVKAVIWLVLGVVLVAGPRARAERVIGEDHVLLQASLGWGFGGSSFAPTLSLPGTPYTGRSQLDWPMNGLLIGLGAALGGRTGTGREWGMSLSFASTVTSPYTTLVDRDWIEGLGQSIEFSHTDTAVTGYRLHADLSARYGGDFSGSASLLPAISAFFVGGVRFEMAQLDGFGANGWVLDADLRKQSVSLPGDPYAIHLDAYRVLPHAGLGVRFSDHWFVFDAEVGPLLAVTVDQDDHVLRNKKAWATCVGGGVLLGGGPRFLLTNRRSRVRVMLGLQFEVRYLHATGTLSQRYYGNDPSLKGVGPSTMISDSTSFSIDSTVGTLAATLGVGF